ncbi:hypothetical protein [uncultured Victivallis sp.]|uniref:hypothetical protein n=1 Tax=uncultured Victivallis sp. TaxID=354118 RepID=UPI0025E33B3E|nr:hypothetical protein [uncultured Victivallis sp.]
MENGLFPAALLFLQRRIQNSALSAPLPLKCSPARKESIFVSSAPLEKIQKIKEILLLRQDT